MASKSVRGVMRPSLKDYLRTGIVRVVTTDEPLEPEELDELEIPEPEVRTSKTVEEKEASVTTPEPKPVPEKRQKTQKARRKSESKSKPKPEGKAKPSASETKSETGVEVSATPVAPVDSVSEPQAVATKVATQDDIGAFLELLSADDHQMWQMMLSMAGEVSHEPLELDTVRNEFQTADLNRFTYYLLPKKDEKLMPIQRLEQIAEPVCCILRWDENGAARISN